MTNITNSYEQILPNSSNKKLSYTQNWMDINYLVPTYNDNCKNQTQIGLEGCSSYQDQRKLSTVLNHLARIFSLDLPTLRENCGKQVNRKNMVPLGFHPGFVLIPVHIRTPKNKDDGATGYVVLSKIKFISNPPEEEKSTGVTRIYFNDDTWLDVQQQSQSLYKLQGEATTISKNLAQLYTINLPTMKSSSVPEYLAENTAKYQYPFPSIPMRMLPQLRAIREYFTTTDCQQNNGNDNYNNTTLTPDITTMLQAGPPLLIVPIPIPINPQPLDNSGNKGDKGKGKKSKA